MKYTQCEEIMFGCCLIPYLMCYTVPEHIQDYNPYGNIYIPKPYNRTYLSQCYI